MLYNVGIRDPEKLHDEPKVPQPVVAEPGPPTLRPCGTWGVLRKGLEGWLVLRCRAEFPQGTGFYHLSGGFCLKYTFSGHIPESETQKCVLIRSK